MAQTLPNPLTADGLPHMSAHARQQLQQYLSRLPTPATSASRSTLPSSSYSSSSASASGAISDTDALLRRSTNLSTRVDSLHASLSAQDGLQDDPQLFWSTLTLLTNLRDLSSRLYRATTTTSVSGDRTFSDTLARTQQNVTMVESMLRLLSVSHTEGSGARDIFTAPIRIDSDLSASAHQLATSSLGDERGYEYWKARTLSALDADDADDRSTFSDDDNEDAASVAESVLTDPDVHLIAPTSKTNATPLAGLQPTRPVTSSNEADNVGDDDYSEYDRALASKPPLSSGASAHNPDATIASDTILQSDRATHEALSSELLRMASVLKTNSLAFADSLERDRLLLEKAGTHLGANLDLMTRTRGRLGVYSKKARSMGWFTLSAILVVIVSWMLMFLLIRLT